MGAGAQQMDAPVFHNGGAQNTGGLFNRLLLGAQQLIQQAGDGVFVACEKLVHEGTPF